jgi:hypothetical protein
LKHPYKIEDFRDSQTLQAFLCVFVTFCLLCPSPLRALVTREAPDKQFHAPSQLHATPAQLRHAQPAETLRLVDQPDVRA